MSPRFAFQMLSIAIVGFIFVLWRYGFKEEAYELSLVGTGWFAGQVVAIITR